MLVYVDLDVHINMGRGGRRGLVGIFTVSEPPSLDFLHSPIIIALYDINKKNLIIRELFIWILRK